MKKYHLALATLITTFTSAAFSQPCCRDYLYVGTVSLGPTWGNGDKSQTFYLAQDVEKTYHAKNSTNTIVDGELFLGIQKNLCDPYQAQLGIAIATTSAAKLSGNIWDDANKRFNNYRYHYKINHTHLALQTKWIINKECWPVMPWLSASMGIGFNSAHGFTNTPIIFQAIRNPNFSAHTKTAFTYTLGLGIEKCLCQHWQAGASYQFADWGKSSLGRAAGQTKNSGLKLSHFYTNGILFNISYLA